MLRVLTLSSLFPTAERPAFGIFVALQTQALAALDGVEVEVVAPVGLPPWPLSLHPHYAARKRLPPAEDWNGLTVHRPRYPTLPGPGRRLNGRAMARALLPVLQAIRSRFPFEVIDAQFFWPDGVAAMHLAEALDLPFCVKARGSDIHFWARQRNISGQIAKAGCRAGRLLAVSRALSRDMAALGLPADRIKVHYTGVDTTMFRPADRSQAKARLGVEGALIVAAGALIPLKGQALAIDTLDRMPTATLILVGDGPERPALERRAARFEGRVRFLGEQPQGELPALLAAADVMVLPSEREGLANVWLEALACGTPIVIPDVGGAREVIDRPEAGRIVARDPQAIAAAVNAILANPPAQDDVRRAAERFSSDRSNRELAGHLAALVERQ